MGWLMAAQTHVAPCMPPRPLSFVFALRPIIIIYGSSLGRSQQKQAAFKSSNFLADGGKRMNETGKYDRFPGADGMPA